MHNFEIFASPANAAPEERRKKEFDFTARLNELSRARRLFTVTPWEQGGETGFIIWTR